MKRTTRPVIPNSTGGRGGFPIPNKRPPPPVTNSGRTNAPPPVITPPATTLRIVNVGELLAAQSATLAKTASSSGPQQQTVAGDGSLVPVCYGKRRVGARIPTVLTYNGNLVLLCVWALGEIDAVESVQINDAAIPAGVTVTSYLGTSTQNADATLVAAFAAQGKTYADNLRGVAYSVVNVSSSAAVTGFPRCSAVIRGQRVNQAHLAYVQLNGSSQFASTPDTTNTRVNEDFEIEACVSLNDWTPAAVATLVSKWQPTGNLRAYALRVLTGGALELLISGNGTAFNTYTSSAATGIADGTRAWIKVEFVKNNGANSTAKFFTSTDGIAYTQLGTTQTAATVATIFASTYETRIGNDAAGALLAGKVWFVRLDTPTKRVLDFLPWNQTAGLASWVGDAAETWTLQSSAVINTGMLAYSVSPAYAVADLIRSAGYGMSRRVDLRTALLLYERNAEVIGSGGATEARHEFGMLLDSSRKCEEWLLVLCDYAHCWAVREGNTYVLIRDANDGVAATFDSGSIVADSMRVSKRGARDQPTCVEVTYTNVATTPWRDDTVTQYLPGVLGGSVPRRMQRISKTGLTRYSEANRCAIEKLNESTLIDTLISFVAFDEAANIRVGDLVAVNHPIGFGPVTGYPTGKPFRVMRSEPIAPGRWRLSCTEFDPGIYSTVVETGPTLVDTVLPNPANPPQLAGLAATEDVVQTKDGLYVSRIRFDWADPATFPLAFIRSYRVQILDNSVVPAVLVHTSDSSSRPVVSPPLKELVPYIVRVAIVSTVGAVGPIASVNLIPQGKYLPPGDVSSLVGFEAGGRVFLSWAAAIDLTLDTIRYEIRYGAVSSNWDVASRVDRVSALSYGTPGFPSGTYRFFVKALDSVGNYSANAAFVDVTVSVDAAAFSAYTYLNQNVEALAMTENLIAGNRIATTDWGDAIGYGHSTQLNTSGLWDDGTVPASTVGTQPHRQGLLFSPSVPRYVTVPYVASHNVGNTFYIEAWVYPLSNDATGRSVFSARTNNDAGGWDLRVTDGTLLITGAGTFLSRSVETLPLFKWSHVAAKVTSNTNHQLYINGKEVTYSTGPSTSFTYANNTNQRWIGGIRTGAVFAFDGLILRVKLWNTALSDANRLISMQYDSDPTSIGGMVGCWQGAANGEGSTSTTYTDSGTGASNGTVTPSAIWRSWSETLAQTIDLGQVINGTFTVSGGDPTSLSGAVGPLIRLSLDAVSWTTYQQPTVVASARFFKYGYEAQGGSMSVNLTTMRGDVLVTPRVEAQTITCAASGIQTAVLAGLYAKVIDLQVTPAGTPNAWFAVPDQIEVGPKGIAGGVKVGRFGTGAGPVGRGTRASLVMSSTVTVECWMKIEVVGSAVFNIPWCIESDSNPGAHRLVFYHNTTSPTDGIVYMEGSVTGSVQFFLSGVATRPPPQGQWTHIAVAMNGSACSLYYDAVLVGTCTFASAASTSTARVWTVGGTANTFNFLSGKLYELRVWNVVRTPTEIANNYKTRVATDSNLKVYLKVDGNLLDSSGNANDYTAAGTVDYRPLNGFDVYLFNNSAARQAGDVRCRWTGA
jgi:hypothetical protein